MQQKIEVPNKANTPRTSHLQLPCALLLLLLNVEVQKSWGKLLNVACGQLTDLAWWYLRNVELGQENIHLTV